MRQKMGRRSRKRNKPNRNGTYFYLGEKHHRWTRRQTITVVNGRSVKANGGNGGVASP